MKKILTLCSISIISTLLLTGCFSNEREGLIKDAKDQYANGNTQESFNLLEKAKRLDSFDSSKEADIKKMYEEIVNKLYVKYVTEGNNQVKEKNYEEALSAYQNALHVYSSDSKLAAKVDSVQKLKAKQEEFNKYVSFFSSVIVDSNTLLREFNESLNQVYLKNISRADFLNRVKSIIPKSNEILNRFDDIHNTVSGSLFDTHQSLLSLVNNQHQLFLDSLKAENEEYNLVPLFDKHTNVKQAQNSLIQNLRNYGNNESLKVELNLSSSEQSTNNEVEVPLQTDSNE